MIKNARAHDSEDALKIAYIHSDADKLDSIRKESFDVVFANMSLMDIEDARGAISEVARVLKKGGRLVASICHPCFDNGSKSGWLVEKGMSGTTTYRRIRAYRKPFKERTPWKSAGKTRYTLSFHRPLNWYARVLHLSGLAITALEEPEPTEEFVKEERDATGFAEVPLHLVFEAVKL